MYVAFKARLELQSAYAYTATQATHALRESVAPDHHDVFIPASLTKAEAFPLARCVGLNKFFNACSLGRHLNKFTFSSPPSLSPSLLCLVLPHIDNGSSIPPLSSSVVSLYQPQLQPSLPLLSPPCFSSTLNSTVLSAFIIPQVLF